MKLLRSYVGGRFRESATTFEKTSPVDGRVVARVTEADRALVDEAVSSARRALSGPWGSLPVRERAGMLYDIADGIEARFDEFLEAEVTDTGKPVRLASTIDIPRGAANFRIFADMVKTAGLEAYRTELPRAVRRSITPCASPKESWPSSLHGTCRCSY
jgi:aminomuconate-semialdehyde/2-hydroxymuconate-6-semialdehyde dehydrogenase